ncbi:uncharacterized protein B0H18DRAFT_1218448, partial [Fomitopsis serialis]|uniref:uncharacterized protein n=1 Tax=Fomitopsis serialis TaxID=139415 RepID=UPI0020085F1D
CQVAPCSLPRTSCLGKAAATWSLSSRRARRVSVRWRWAACAGRRARCRSWVKSILASRLSARGSGRLAACERRRRLRIVESGKERRAARSLDARESSRVWSSEHTCLVVGE